MLARPESHCARATSHRSLGHTTALRSWAESKVLEVPSQRDKERSDFNIEVASAVRCEGIDLHPKDWPHPTWSCT